MVDPAIKLLHQKRLSDNIIVGTAFNEACADIALASIGKADDGKTIVLVFIPDFLTEFAAIHIRQLVVNDGKFYFLILGKDRERAFAISGVNHPEFSDIEQL